MTPGLFNHGRCDINTDNLSSLTHQQGCHAEINTGTATKIQYSVSFPKVSGNERVSCSGTVFPDLCRNIIYPFLPVAMVECILQPLVPRKLFAGVIGKIRVQIYD